MASERYAACFRGFVWPWYMSPLDDYRVLASQFPFRELKIWGENADRFFPDADAMIRWINQPSLVPFLPCVPETEREGFRHEVIEGMVKAAKQEDGKCF